MFIEKKISRYIITWITTLLMLLAIWSVISLTASAAGSTVDVKVNVTYGQTEARSMIEYINKFRAGNDVDGQRADYYNQDDTAKIDLTGKLEPLTYDYNLEKIAMQRAAEIAVSFDHTRPDGTLCWTAWSGSGSWQGYGENIAAGSSSAFGAFRQWREDNYKYSGQGHRRNMLSQSLTRIGIGHVVYNGTHYWTQAFGKGTGSDQETLAADSAKDVTVSVNSSDMLNLSVTADPSEYTLKEGDANNLPVVTYSFRMTETWPARDVSTTADAAWTSDNTSVVSIQNGELLAHKAGNANLKTTVNGTSLSVPVTVKGEEIHTHNLEATPAKDATCIEIGNTAYWTCSGCGKYFSDAEGENEITADDWVIKASGHKLVHIDEKSPTETEDGNTEYWSCSVCEKYFSDANGEIEIDKSDWFIPAVSHVHKPEVIPAVASTCTKPGFTEGSKCSVCGEILKSQTVIPAKGHTPVEDPAVEPTTTTTGLTAGSHCSVCGEILLKQEVIPKKSDSGQENSGQGNNEQGNNEQGNNGQGNNGQGNNGQGNNGQGNNRQETAKQNKNPQPMTVKAAKQKTVKFSRLKKKAQTVKPITVKSAQGTVSYKITGGSKKSKKALKMSAKTGKITVKRGTKKGIYKLKVTVKAAGNAEYDAGSKTVNVSVKVK